MAEWFVDENGSPRIFNFVLAFLGILLFGVFLSYVALGLNWLALPTKIADPSNVQREYEWFYQQHASLKQFKANIGTTQARSDALRQVHGSDTAKWTLDARNEYTQLVSILENDKRLYNNACAAYQARWDNVFHNVVAPNNIPRDCELIGR